MPYKPEYIEPRWPTFLAMAAVVALHFALPPPLRFVPGWLLIAIFAVFAILTFYFHKRADYGTAYVLGLFLLSCVTIALAGSLCYLILSLPTHKIEPFQLLQGAASLWLANVLIFAGWYWKLDAGGPHKRERASNHEDGAFLFPQMALHPGSAAKPCTWHPRFLDYLFLAFNTSTALSPTDTQILSPWAKALMMLQSLISLTVIALLAARAVNIL